MTSLSGVCKNSLFKWVLNDMNNTKINQELSFILSEIQSLHAENELWQQCIEYILHQKSHNILIQYLYDHYESFHEYSTTTKKNVLTKCVHMVKQYQPISLKTMDESIKCQFLSNKRAELRIWKGLQRTDIYHKLWCISTMYPEIENTHIRLLCYHVASCKQSGQ